MALILGSDFRPPPKARIEPAPLHIRQIAAVNVNGKAHAGPEVFLGMNFIRHDRRRLARSH